MTDYRKDFAEYVKVKDKDTGMLIGYIKISEDNILSTLHNVEVVTQEEYEESLPKPPEPLKSFNHTSQTFKESSD